MKLADSRLKSGSSVLHRSGWLFTLVVASSVVLTGCEPKAPTIISISDHPSNKAKGMLYGNVNFRSETRYINGEMNYGIATNVTVRNIGQTGFIKVTIFLKCTEGEWSRSEELALCAGEYRTLDYFFQEPTHYAENVECRAIVSP